MIPARMTTNGSASEDPVCGCGVGAPEPGGSANRPPTGVSVGVSVGVGVSVCVSDGVKVSVGVSLGVKVKLGV